MKKLACLLLISCACWAAALEQRYTFFVGETAVGKATMVFEKLPDGGTRFSVDLAAGSGKDAMRQRQDDRYDKDSRHVSSSTVVEQSGKTKTTRLAYGPKELTMTITENGKSVVKKFAYPKGKNIAEPSQAWFFLTTPMPNAVSKETAFDTKTLRWTNRERRYVGRVEIEMAGKTVKAYELHDLDKSTGEVVKSWVDGFGMPYRMEFGSGAQAMSLVRAAE